MQNFDATFKRSDNRVQYSKVRYCLYKYISHNYKIKATNDCNFDIYEPMGMVFEGGYKSDYTVGGKEGDVSVPRKEQKRHKKPKMKSQKVKPLKPTSITLQQFFFKSKTERPQGEIKATQEEEEEKKQIKQLPLAFKSALPGPRIVQDTSEESDIESGSDEEEVGRIKGIFRQNQEYLVVHEKGRGVKQFKFGMEYPRRLHRDLYEYLLRRANIPTLKWPKKKNLK